MSPQSNPQSSKESDTERAQTALGAQPPSVTRPIGPGSTFRRGMRAGRMRARYQVSRAYRPIQGFLVTHRRRFTTGNKHGKNANGGHTPSEG
jgi:hypothetical protein